MMQSTIFRTKENLEKALNLKISKTEFYKMFNCDKQSLEKEIEYWNNPIKQEINKSMEE